MNQRNQGRFTVELGQAAPARRRAVRSSVIRLRASFLLLALLLSGCGWDGHLTVFGYTTRPNYDEHIKTVYVPIFENRTFRRGWEFELTRAVIREIEAKTPFKVVADRDKADTELIGTIISMNKLIINRNQLNEVREGETTLGVEVYWRDLRTGEILSSGRRTGEAPLPPIVNEPLQELPAGTIAPPTAPGDMGRPAAGIASGPVPPGGPGVPPQPPPTLVQSIATFIPELGESLTTAQKKNTERLAVQIVAMMEKPW
jgi:hypothetical protein